MTFIPQEHIPHCTLSFGHGILMLTKKPLFNKKMTQTTILASKQQTSLKIINPDPKQNTLKEKKKP